MARIPLNKYLRYVCLFFAVFSLVITFTGFTTYNTLNTRGETATGFTNSEGNTVFEYEGETYDTRVIASNSEDSEEATVIFDPENPDVAITTTLEVFRNTFITSGIWAVIFFAIYFLSVDKGKKKPGSPL